VLVGGILPYFLCVQYTADILTDRLSPESQYRKPAALKSAAIYLKEPGMISLGGGLPSSEHFPFDELSVKVPSIPRFSEQETHSSGTVLTAGKYDLSEDKSIYDLSIALNYSQGTGAPQLLRWTTEHTEIVHNPPYSDWQTTLTVGSTSSLDMVLRMFRHDNMCILSEEYTFATAVECAGAMGIRVVGIKMDEEGLIASSLDHILSNWDPSAHNNSPKPFLLYTVPSGQNPTGATQSLARRRAIYAVAQKHDLLIVEDEPYYFLQMQPYTGQNAPDVPPPKSHEEFLSCLVPSLLSMDTDGRVMRLDSFSKVIAPGSRLGWVTAPAQLIERYFRHSDVSTQGPCGFAMLALFKLLDEHWGHSGFLDWLVHIRLEYTKRRDVLLAACEKHLPMEVVSWKPPMAGMFHWLRVDWKRHPEAGKVGLAELEDRIWHRAIGKGSLLIKGSWFRAPESGRGNASGEAAEKEEEEGMFFRATFCAAPSDQMDEAIRRFSEAIREEFGLGEREDTNGHGKLTGMNGHA